MEMEMEMKILAWRGLLSKNSPTSRDDLVFQWSCKPAPRRMVRAESQLLSNFNSPKLGPPLFHRPQELLKQWLICVLRRQAGHGKVLFPKPRSLPVMMFWNFLDFSRYFSIFLESTRCVS
jgi:hypothetical protein